MVIGISSLRLDMAPRPNKRAPAIGVGLGVRIARMIGIACDIAARRAVDRDARVDLLQIAIAAPFEPAGFGGVDAGAFVFGDFFTLFDRPYREQTEAGK